MGPVRGLQARRVAIHCRSAENACSARKKRTHALQPAPSPHAPASIAGKALLKRSGRSPDDISSIVLVEDDQSYIKSEAILRIGRRLNVPLQVLGTMGLIGVPGFLRDAAYDAVSAVGQAALLQGSRQSK